MAEDNMAECAVRIRAAAGDCICPVCGTKVIGGDHTEIECGRIKRLKEVLASSGHRIEAC